MEEAGTRGEVPALKTVVRVCLTYRVEYATGY